MGFCLYEFASASACEKELSQAISQSLQQILLTQKRAILALSGGKSPLGLFGQLSQINLAWERVNVTLVDERIVEPQSSNSNGRLVREHFLQNQARKACWIPFFESLDDVGHNMGYDMLLEQAREHFCQPHIAILGMGEDGHMASIFPHMQEGDLDKALSTQDLLIHTRPLNAPYERLSMSLFSLERVQMLYLFMLGENKKAILKEALKGPNQAYPISFILHSQKVVCHVYYA